jgi:autotransporter passenger strand-loop-strand repeat protein
MVGSISQPYGATNLDPVGAGDVQSAGTPVDPRVVGGSSEDAGAAFVVGDPGLAASADSVESTGASAAQANPLAPARSSGASDTTGSAVQLGGSLAGGGAAAASDSPVIAGGLASGAVAGVVTGGGSAVAASSGAASEAGTSGALSQAATFVSKGPGGGDVWVVTGSGGLTFDVSFDQVASALPTGFENDVLSAFRYYADTFNNSGVTLYFNVGFGEIQTGGGGSSTITGNALGESFTFFGGTQTYSTLSSTMSARAAASGDAADTAAVANDLPATDPTGGKTLVMARAEEKALGLVSGTAGSFANPDGNIGFGSSFSFDYTSGQTPNSGTYDFLGVVEHEISEVMGRNSWLDLNGASDYSALDLFRFSSAGAHQLTTGNPSDFSLDGGNTDLYNWNNFNTGNSGDLGDWAGTTPYTPDSFNDNSNSGVLNPITSRDTTLLDVLGWSRTNSTTYTVGPGPASSGIIIYSGDREMVQSGGTAVATYALSGGLEVVSAGGSDSGATLSSGAEQDVFGSANAVVVNGGLQVVESGGVASATTINGSGTLTVSSGGSAVSDTINGGGSETVLSGGTASTTRINSGGSLTVSGMFATAIATTINNGGSETVLAGGSGFNDVINSGGSETLLSGGFADSTINSGGRETVSAGGSAGQDAINGGLLTVSSGGTATGTTVNSAGSQIVSAGGSTTSTTISSGGLEVVSASGTTVNPAISGSGAVLDLLSGAIVSGGITFGGSGGQLQIAGTVMPSSTISGFISGDTFDLASIAFDSLGRANLGANSQLQITEGGITYDLNLDPAQDYSSGNQFQLTADSGGGTLVSINTALTEPQSTLPVSIGGTATISTSFLFSSDVDYASAQLTYTVLTPPTHGTILLNGTAATSFTQADIDNGLVQYRENGDVASDDSFTFQIADPAGNRVGPEGFTVAILHTAAPVIAANAALPVSIDSAATIWTKDLCTLALGDEPAELKYRVTAAPAHGTLLVNGTAATSFTQADIDNKLVQYRASGDGATSDSFSFQVTDAAGDQTPVTTFNIDIRSRAPTAPAVDGATTVVGAWGDTITGGSGATLIIGIAGSQAIFGGSGATTVLGGAGDTITGGTGTLALYIDHPHSPGAAFVGDNGTKGSDTVTGFSQPAGDRIFFLNETAAGVNSVVASAQTKNGNTLITLPDGATMTLIGVTKVDSTFFG